MKEEEEEKKGGGRKEREREREREREGGIHPKRLVLLFLFFSALFYV